MYPVIYQFSNGAIISGYGCLIAIGYIVTYLYLNRECKNNFNVNKDFVPNLSFIIFVGVVVGGKLFFYLEKPSYYFGDFSNMFKKFNVGFVVYGSLIFALPMALIYVKKKNIPLLPMADALSIGCCIIQFFGRAGCFMAGCCHGKLCHLPFAVVFTNPNSFARPLGFPLHPTQIYSMFVVLIIFLTLLFFRKRKKFHGQLILIYMFMYSIGRSIVEIFRGDENRGYVIDGIISHSQFISIIVMILAIATYLKLRKNKITQK